MNQNITNLIEKSPKLNKLNCSFCYKETKKSQLFIENFLKEKNYYFACTDCINSNTFYSLYFIKSNFILEDKYLKEVKFLFSNNILKKILNYESIESEKLYLEADILNLIKKQHKLREKNKDKENDINSRRNLIKDTFENLQLKYSEVNDIYNFIQYGKPELSEIITNHLTVYNKLNELRYQFMIKIKNKNLNFHCNMLSLKKYLNNDYENIDELMELAEIESKLLEKSNYSDYLDKLENNDNNINEIENIFNLTLNELPKKDYFELNKELNSKQRYLINKEFYLT